MFVARYDANLLPGELQDWLATRSSVLTGGMQSIAGTVSFVAFIALCLGLLGLFAFQRWARPLTLWATVAIYLPMPLSGAAVLSGFAYLMDSVAAILWGVLLAAAYWAPVSTEFDRPRAVAPRVWWRRRAPGAVPAPVARADPQRVDTASVETALREP